MVARPQVPKQGKTAVATAALVLAGWFTAPVLAAPERDVLCDEAQDATLEISEFELTATPVNASEEILHDHLLKSDVKAAAREVFSDTEDRVDADESDADTVETTEIDEPRMHRVSGSKPSPYKRKMYRRDI